jgi:hypothetical protein
MYYCYDKAKLFAKMELITIINKKYNYETEIVFVFFFILLILQVNTVKNHRKEK